MIENKKGGFNIIKLRKLLTCELFVITALSLCSCGKDGDKNSFGATNSGDGSNFNSHEGTYILIDEIIENMVQLLYNVFRQLLH